MTNKLLCAFLLAVIGLAIGIQVDPVKLINNGQYISYQLGAGANLTVLVCPIQLQKEETLQKVTWKFFSTGTDVGSYEWTKGSGGVATGRLEGVVRLDKQDANLELTAIRYDLAGFYSCSATEAGGKTAEAAPWELLIVDTTANSRHERLDAIEGHCKYRSSFKTSPVFPEPTIHSGLFSKSKGSFVKEVEAINWHKQTYENGSVAYSHDNVEIELNRDAPFDVVFLNVVGVTKADGSYIPLTATRTTKIEFTERGCEHIKLRAYQSITYNNDKKSCREEILPPVTGSLKATVTCMDGYKPEGDVKFIELSCNPQTWEWENADNLYSLMCVLGGPYGEEPGSGITVGYNSLLLLICLVVVRLHQE